MMDPSRNGRAAGSHAGVSLYQPPACIGFLHLMTSTSQQTYTAALQDRSGDMQGSSNVPKGAMLAAGISLRPCVLLGCTAVKPGLGML